MAGTKEIKRRIKSVKNTKKITKAMELVSASKMKRAVNATLRSRLYAEYSWDVLTSIAKNVEEITHPFFTERTPEQKTGKVLLLLITSSRGLCGGYNAQAIKKALSSMRMISADVDVITIGKKGDVAMHRAGKNVLASFFEIPDNNISLRDVTPVSNLAIREFSLGTYDRVLAVYTDYISALTQKPAVKQILPVSKQELQDLIESAPDELIHAPATRKTQYLFEGDQQKFIGILAEKLTKMQIYQMLLESNASEQSSRMMAMKNASEASGEMIDELTLMFNKARQSNITREISEISAGMASVN